MKIKNLCNCGEKAIAVIFFDYEESPASYCETCLKSIAEEEKRLHTYDPASDEFTTQNDGEHWIPISCLRFFEGEWQIKLPSGDWKDILSFSTKKLYATYKVLQAAA